MHAARRLLALALLAVAFTSIACKRDERKSSTSTAASAPTSVALGPTTSAVREAFDRDVGTVRVLMLVSPT